MWWPKYNHTMHILALHLVCSLSSRWLQKASFLWVTSQRNKPTELRGWAEDLKLHTRCHCDVCTQRNIFITISKDVSPTGHLLRCQQANKQQTFLGRRSTGVQVLTMAPLLSVPVVWQRADTNWNWSSWMKSSHHFIIYTCCPRGDMSKCLAGKEGLMDGREH